MPRKNKKKKMALGGKVSDPLSDLFQMQYGRKVNAPNYIQSPDESLAENNIAVAKAMSKAQSNPLSQGLDIFGNMALQYGIGKMSSGINAGEGLFGNSAVTGTEEFLPSGYNVNIPNVDSVPADVLRNLIPKKAYGGKVTSPVEVEGEEVTQLPNGQVIEHIGPSHDEGGIPTELPNGSQVYSKRIKENGKTMAKKKLGRERQMKKLTNKKYGSTDKLLKNAVERQQVTNSIQDMFDLQLQEQIKQQEFNIPGTEKLKYGTSSVGDNIDLEESVIGPRALTPFGVPLPTSTSTVDPVPSDVLSNILKSHIADNTVPMPKGNTDDNSFLDMLKGMPTGGDMLGMFGNIKQAFDPYQTTLESRAGDTPNTNSFKDYGKDGLKTLDKAKGLVAGIRDSQTKDILDKQVAANARGRNTARGVNTVRALDIATNRATLDAMSNVQNNFANQMLGILNTEAQFENNQDQAVMKGEASADLANRQDRDAFYSQVAKDKQAIGEAYTRTGKSINDVKERNVNNNFLNMLYDYIDGDLTTGEMKIKDGVDVTRDKNGTIFIDKKEPENKIDPTEYNNLLNPKTNKVFTESQYKKYLEDVKDNPYLDAPKEADTSYKNFLDPNTKKPFSSITNYNKFLETGKKAEEYVGADLFKGDKKISSKLSQKDKEQVKTQLGIYLRNNNMSDFNLDDAASIKALEKKLGLKETGIIGPKVLRALKLENIDIKFD